jgi:hypothetical protein
MKHVIVDFQWPWRVEEEVSIHGTERLLWKRGAKRRGREG